MVKPSLPDSFWQELADHNPIGIPLTAQDARDWFEFVWLRYSTHGYRNHKRAIINWWSRVYESEIERAQERASRIRSEAENARLEALAEQEAQPRGNVIDFASRLAR